MNILTVDIKGISTLHMQNVGCFSYAGHESTRPLCMLLKENDKGTVIWLPPELVGIGIPTISSSEMIRMFERASPLASA